MQTKIFPGQLEQLADISLFVVQVAEEAGLDESAVYAVQLAVDEAATNIIEHAYQGEDRGEICCSIESNQEGVKITLQDWGIPFNPAEIPEPIIGAPLEEVQSSGLGLFFIRKLMDEVRFDFSADKGNTVTMIKKRSH
jgi:serine/threonine-protein kinase RsbW